jgi:hypothetical protein
MTDPDHDWPTLPREPDVWVLNKVDLRRQGAHADARHELACTLHQRQNR